MFENVIDAKRKWDYHIHNKYKLLQLYIVNVI